MLNRLCRTIDLKILLSLQNGGRAKLHLPDIERKLCSCMNSNASRFHSSLSDSRRQKVLLETSTPKIVLEKVIDNKVLPDEKKLSKLSEWREIIDPYLKLMRIDKPIGTWLLFWPCSWSIGLAASTGVVPMSVALYNLGLFFAGSFIMRGAGCTINDIWDQDIDGRVERTKDRPLVSGALSERQAIVFLAAQLSAGLAILMQLNWYSVALGASSMVLVVTYPLAKRFTNYPQIFLGATFNWGALLGYSAVSGAVEPAVCAPLYLGSLLWTVVYDTIYAHQDKNDDARIGIKSTALTFGDDCKAKLAACGLAAFGCFSAAGLSAAMGWPFYAALGVAGAHVGRQIYTLDVNNPEDCACKFKSNSLVGLVIFLGIIGGGWSHYVKGKSNGQLLQKPAMDHCQ